MTQFLRGRIKLHAGDCLLILDHVFEENSIDACVTDPPYHLASIVKRFGKDDSAPAQHGSDGLYARASRGFMGKQWDGGDIAFRPETWTKVKRVLKPGAHLVAFAAPKNYHRLACAIEDAGFEIRDSFLDLVSAAPLFQAFFATLDDEQAGAFCRLIDEADPLGLLAWVFGSGFPKSHDVAKALAAAEATGHGNPEGIRRLTMGADYAPSGRGRINYDHGAPSVMNGAHSSIADMAQPWSGFGTALKPAYEPIVLARKPISEKSVAANVLRWGTGALNIDGCRIHAEDAQGGDYTVKRLKPGAALNATGGNWRPEEGAEEFHGSMKPGRWPANVVTDGSDEVVAAFPEAPGQQRSVGPEFGSKDSVTVFGDYGPRETFEPRKDFVSAARFFYSAKADKDDRLGSKHPTVKPVDLIQWLCRLVVPPKGTVLDPFAGTGTTGEAAWRENMNAVLIEREAEYRADIGRRMTLCTAGPMTRSHEIAKAQGEENETSLPLFADRG